jgi:drug/metabolite transporter (DMT)-like permease
MAPETTRPGTMSATKQGIGWIIVATVIFTATNTLAKALGENHHVVQIVWGRYSFHLLFLIIILRGQIFSVMKTRHLKLQLGRSALLLCTAILYFLGFTYLPLAESAAVMNVTPILVILLSVMILGERVSIQQWAGVFAGFCGVLVIVRPGFDAFSPAILLPLSAAMTYAFYQIATRYVSHADTAMTSITYTALVGTVMGSIAVPFYWVTPDLAGWLMMAGIGLSGALGHYAMIRAFSVAEASTVSPFTYAVILWMIIIGYVVFDDIPHMGTLIGAGMVIASGLYISAQKAKSEAKAKVPVP